MGLGLDLSRKVLLGTPIPILLELIMGCYGHRNCNKQPFFTVRIAHLQDRARSLLSNTNKELAFLFSAPCRFPSRLVCPCNLHSSGMVCRVVPLLHLFSIPCSCLESQCSGTPMSCNPGRGPWTQPTSQASNLSIDRRGRCRHAHALLLIRRACRVVALPPCSSGRS